MKKILLILFFLVSGSFLMGTVVQFKLSNMRGNIVNIDFAEDVLLGPDFVARVSDAFDGASITRIVFDGDILPVGPSDVVEIKKLKSVLMVVVDHRLASAPVEDVTTEPSAPTLYDVILLERVLDGGMVVLSPNEMVKVGEHTIICSNPN